MHKHMLGGGRHAEFRRVMLSVSLRAGSSDQSAPSSSRSPSLISLQVAPEAAA